MSVDGVVADREWIDQAVSSKQRQRFFLKCFLLFVSAVSLSTQALAQNRYPHISCSYGACATPETLDQPTLEDSNPHDGGFRLSVDNGDVYGWTRWSNGRIGNSMSVSGLATGSYSYRARACIYTGSRDLCGSYSPSRTVTVRRKAATPSKPSITSSRSDICQGRLKVTWPKAPNVPSDAGTIYYNLNENRPGSGNDGTRSGRTSRTWTINNAEELATFKYKVQTYHKRDNVTSRTSSWSSTATLTTLQCAPNKPGAPTLNQDDVSSPDVSISWTDPGSPRGSVRDYTVRRGLNSNGPWTELGGTCATSNTHCTDSTVPERGQTYYYAVRANRSHISSDWGPAAAVTVKWARPPRPQAPGINETQAGGYRLSWNAVGDPNLHGTIEYQVSESGSWGGDINGTYTPVSIEQPATLYEYRVRACNPDGLCGDPSPPTAISRPGQPASLSVRADTIESNGSRFLVEWGAAAAVSGSDHVVSDYTLEAQTNRVGGYQPVFSGAGLSRLVDQANPGDYLEYRVRASNFWLPGEWHDGLTYWVPGQPESVSVNLTGTVAAPELAVNWPAAADAAGYRLQMSTDGGQNWGQTRDVGSGTSFSPTVVTPGRDYRFQVAACNEQGACSRYNLSQSIRIPFPAPGAPGDVQASLIDAETGRVRISWTAAPGQVGQYRVSYSIDGGDNWSVPETGVSPLMLSALTGGLSYRFRVEACNVDACTEAVSADVFELPPALPVLGINPQPDCTNIINEQHDAGWAGQYTVCWAPPASAEVQTVTVEEHDGNVWQPAASSAVECHAGQCRYDKPANYKEGEDPNDYYGYRAQACNGENCSAWKTLTVRVIPYPLPGQPTGFRLTGEPAPEGDYTLQWHRPDGGAELHFYQIDQVHAEDLDTAGNDTENAPDCDISPDIPSDCRIPHNEGQLHGLAFSGGGSGQTYRYRVRACYGDKDGCALWTDPLAVYIPHAPPVSLTHTDLDISGVSYTLHWNAPDGAPVDHYRLQTRGPGDATWEFGETVEIGTTGYLFLGTRNGVEYTHRLQACDAAGECGQYSEPYTVYVPYLQPGVPAQLYRESADPRQSLLTLAWTAPAETDAAPVETYHVLHSTDGGATWGEPVETAATQYTATELANGQQHQFIVAACNVDACSDDTAPLAVDLPYTAPDVPGALSHDDTVDLQPQTGAFTVHWSAPAVVDAAIAPVRYYRIEYSGNDGTTWQGAPVGGTEPGWLSVDEPAPGAPAEATLAGLTAGITYTLRVSACSTPDICSEPAAAYRVKLPYPAPAAPAFLTTNTDPGSLDYTARRFTLNWTAPDDYVHHYQLQLHNGLEGERADWLYVLQNTSTQSHTAVERRYGKAYRYRVRACSEPGDADRHCSAWSETVPPVRLKYPTPAEPGGLVVNNLDHANQRYELTWNGVLGWAPKYRYELRQAPAGTAPDDHAAWALISDEVGQTGFLIENQPPGDYAHQVRACNPAPDNDCSDWSPKTEVSVLIVPGPPAGFTADERSCRIDLAWTPPSGTASGEYRYELAVKDASNNWQGLAWTSGTTHRINTDQVDSGESYTLGVRVRVFKNGRYTPWSPRRTLTASAVACGGADYDGAMVSAPPYSSNGRYQVRMKASKGYYTAWPEYTLGGVHGSYFAMDDEIVSETEHYRTLTYDYTSANPNPTALYIYRFRVCYDNTENPSPCYGLEGYHGPWGSNAQWQEAQTETIVLRSPGAIQASIAGVGTPDPIDDAYRVGSGTFTLNWTEATAPGPAHQEYEIQYKRADADDWAPWDTLSGTTQLQIALPEFGTPYDYRVRACNRFGGYVNCGAWAAPNASVKQIVGPPRFAADTYPADGELIIYDRQVPLQWLPPWSLAEVGELNHYQISMRSRHVDDEGQTYWLGPEVKTTVAPVPGDDIEPPTQQARVEVAGSGLKEFQIRACGSPSPGSCGEALVFQITVIVPPEPPERPTQPSGEVDPDPGGDIYNGALSGELAVTPGGAATYTLPIITPPGTAGVEPKIGLTYSSQAGNGIAGRGWSIDGLSAISRCNKTRAHDDAFSAIQYDDNDALCLDGQRLVEIRPGEYRTERNDFRRIVRQSGGACGTWYRVKTQAGETLEYGKTQDGCINAELAGGQTVIHSWALNRVTDAVGNYMLYEYLEETAEGANAFAIDRIKYTGHPNHAPYTAIDFQYDTVRPDPVSAYIGGAGFTQVRRLIGITTGVSPDDAADTPAGYGQYTLAYADEEEQVDRISRLTSITYCATDWSGGAGRQCMEPLEFQWSPFKAGWEPLADYRPPRAFADMYPAKDRGARLEDVNNDGLPDLLYAAPDAHVTYINSGTGWQQQPLWTSPVDFVDAEGHDLGVRVTDITGDGYPELLTSINDGNDFFQVYRNTQSGWVLDEALSLPTRFVIQPKHGDIGLRVADLDGDGLADLILAKPNPFRDLDVEPIFGPYEAAWRNTGSSDPRWEEWEAYVPEASFMDYRDQVSDWTIPEGSDQLFEPAGWLTDINGDGLVDLLFKERHEERPDYENQETIPYGVFENTGSGWSDEPTRHISAMLDYGRDGPDAGVRLPDLNGDGLPDLLRGNHDNDAILYNTGAGWADVADVYEHTPMFQFMSTSYNPVDRGRRLVDLNHDGRTDVLANNDTAWLSTENGWHELPSLASPVGLSASRAASTMVADVNGDGRLDILRADSSRKDAWTQLSGPRYIISVTDGLGNVTEVKYKAITDKTLDGRSEPVYSRTDGPVNTPRQQEMNVPMRVVDRVTVNDGIGGDLTTEYRYKGLTAVYGGRGLQHFEQVTTISPRGEVATTRYHQDFPYTGMPRELEVIFGRELISRTVNEYCYAVTGGEAGDPDPETAGYRSIDPDTDCLSYNDAARSGESVFVYVKKTRTENHRLDSRYRSTGDVTTVTTRNTYGRYGYLTESTATTTGDGHTYTTQTDNVYHPDEQWQWLGRLTDSTVTRTVDGAMDANSIRRTAFEYRPDTGLLWKEIVEPGAGAPDELHTVHRYDAYGNTAQITACADNFGGCTAEAGVTNPNPDGEAYRITVTEYDNRGRFPVNQRNALGHTETYRHEHPLGLQTELTGPNSITTRWQYDSLGRKVRQTFRVGQTLPDNTPAEYETTWNYRWADNGYPSGARYRVETDPADAAPTRVYYDGRGRERRTLTQNLHGEWVAADIEYTRFGEVLRESAPYFVHTTVGADASWTVNRYDRLGRPQQVQVPLGDIDNDGVDNGMAVSTTEYHGFETVVTDPKGRSKRVELDALERTVRQVEDEGNLNIAVKYRYDSQGNLIETVTDAGGPAPTVIGMQYDSRGNKTSMNDPDMGEWHYHYNAFGELVWQRDAKGQVTEIDYDALGRMTGRSETDDNADVHISSWTYDTAPGAGIGKLHHMHGPSGTSKCHAYDGLGQRTSTTTAMGDCTSDNDTAKRFTVHQEHDRFGRRWRVHYPQAGHTRLTVENVYSRFGGLWYVRDVTDPAEPTIYWIAETLDARGRLMQETLRNDNTISRDFNAATGWLKKIESWDANLAMIQQTRFGFDTAGNMEYRERFRPWVVTPDGHFHAADNEEVRERFTYDSLDRLTGATLTRNGSEHSSQRYDYDRLGNFLYKDADTSANRYHYNSCGAGPHAVCRAKGSQFTYDANGNMITSTPVGEGGKQRTLAYSPFNKPVEITEDGTTVRFTYGADRSRVHKSATGPDGKTVSTWYIGLGGDGQPLYELNERVNEHEQTVREHLHFIYAGGHHDGRPFAVRIEEQLLDTGGITLKTESRGHRYYHRDHLGSVIAVTDDIGTIHAGDGSVRAQLMSFDAFGKRREADWRPSGEDGPNQYSGGSPGNLDYTGQEAVPEVGLIHMNGRVYDPELGVFLSADPHIQAAGISQNYHRYAYVLNNPLKYNDPSGYWVQVVVGIIVAATVEQAIVAMAIMFVVSYIETGDLRIAMITAITTGLTWGVGSAFQGTSGFAAGLSKAFVHGLTQGIYSVALGGDFRSGFTGGFLGSVTGPMVPKNIVAGTVVSAMIGGTISELTGGKFRNGARSAAFVHLFNEAVHNEAAKSSYDQEELDRVRSELYDELEGMSIYGESEAGYILYEGPNGEIRVSDLIIGKRNQLLEGGHFGVGKDGNGYVLEGQYGIDKTSKMIEVLHTHPDSSARRFSGGEFGDVWFSEKFNTDMSLSYDRKRYIYKPTGKVDLSEPKYIPERGGVPLK